MSPNTHLDLRKIHTDHFRSRRRNKSLPDQPPEFRPRRNVLEVDWVFGRNPASTRPRRREVGVDPPRLCRVVQFTNQTHAPIVQPRYSWNFIRVRVLELRPLPVFEDLPNDRLPLELLQLLLPGRDPVPAFRRPERV